MNLLLDTHVFIWFSEDRFELSAKAKQLIEDPHNVSFISISSLWEMAIKVSLGKLTINRSFERTMQAIEENGFEILPITFEHTLQVSQLPFHHRDPFDRILIAQSIVESIPIITADAAFGHYPTTLIWK